MLLHTILTLATLCGPVPVSGHTKVMTFEVLHRVCSDSNLGPKIIYHLPRYLEPYYDPNLPRDLCDLDRKLRFEMTPSSSGLMLDVYLMSLLNPNMTVPTHA